jgi:hypothetical protein
VKSAVHISTPVRQAYLGFNALMEQYTNVIVNFPSVCRFELRAEYFVQASPQGELKLVQRVVYRTGVLM